MHILTSILNFDIHLCDTVPSILKIVATYFHITFKYTFQIHINVPTLKWMVQCHKDVYQNSRLRLEYAYVLFNKFMMNRITSELVKIGQILTSFSVTESTCDDSF